MSMDKTLHDSGINFELARLSIDKEMNAFGNGIVNMMNGCTDLISVGIEKIRGKKNQTLSAHRYQSKLKITNNTGVDVWTIVEKQEKPHKIRVDGKLTNANIIVGNSSYNSESVINERMNEVELLPPISDNIIQSLSVIKPTKSRFPCDKYNVYVHVYIKQKDGTQQKCMRQSVPCGFWMNINPNHIKPIPKAPGGKWESSIPTLPTTSISI